MFKLKILTKSMGNATQEDVAKKKKKNKMDGHEKMEVYGIWKNTVVK